VARVLFAAIMLFAGTAVAFAQGGGHHMAEVKMEAVAMREYIAQS
jgi:hypothetical protein